MLPQVALDFEKYRANLDLSHAGVAELVDAQDLKSCVPCGRAGSTPALSTTIHLSVANYQLLKGGF